MVDNNLKKVSYILILPIMLGFNNIKKLTQDEKINIWFKFPLNIARMLNKPVKVLKNGLIAQHKISTKTKQEYLILNDIHSRLKIIIFN